MVIVWPEWIPGVSSPLERLYVPVGTLIDTAPPMLFARHVASRRLSGDEGVVMPEFPHAPVPAETSAVVDTVNVVAAAAGSGPIRKVAATVAVTAIRPTVRRRTTLPCPVIRLVL
jgi:hypothetical protein